MVKVKVGDCRDVLKTLPDESVQCVVTSPPYYGLRDYGTAEWDGGDAECDHRQQLGGEGATSAKQNTSAGTQTIQYRDTCAKCGARRVDLQIGLEQTPDDYVAEMVAVFREVRRVLRDDGTVWLNLGDSYYNYRPGGTSQTRQSLAGHDGAVVQQSAKRNAVLPGLKEKDLIGIPWRVAFALQADGWWLRQDIIWHKPSPMPEGVTDRCTKAHEYVFLLSKSARYYYDRDAVKEEASGRELFGNTGPKQGANGDRNDGGRQDMTPTITRNRRSVWTIATTPYSGAHFATFPPSLIEPMILAGTSEHGACSVCGAPWERVVETEKVIRKRPSGHGEYINGSGRGDKNINTAAGVRSTTTGWRTTCDHADAPVVPCAVLDPFGGAGTTGLVADRLGRDAILIELNPDYAEMARLRIIGDAPMFVKVELE